MPTPITRIIDHPENTSIYGGCQCIYPNLGPDNLKPEDIITDYLISTNINPRMTPVMAELLVDTALLSAKFCPICHTRIAVMLYINNDLFRMCCLKQGDPDSMTADEFNNPT